MISEVPTPSAVFPPDLSAQQLGFLPPVVMDAVPWGAAFGDVVVEAKEQYQPGEAVQVTFR
jgi:hypothetical protein